MGLREQHHNASGRNERMEWNEQRRKQDLGRARLQQKGRTELLGYQQRNESTCSGLMENIPKL